MQNGRAQLLLNRAGPLGVILEGLHNSASEGRLPGGGELVMESLPSRFGRADHIGVIRRTVPISRQGSAANAPLGEIYDGPSQHALDAGHMLNWPEGSLEHDGAEGTARERLELLLRERRPVPLGCGV